MDRIPTFPILIAPACQLVGVRQGRYNLDASVMAETLLEARELCGFDGIYVSRDNWVCHQALGGSLDFPEDDESFCATPLLSSVSGWTGLKVPDPEKAAGMKTVLSAARHVMRSAGKSFYVQANIDTGPFSLAAVLCGTQNFLMDIATEDAGTMDGLLEFCAQVIIAYGRAMIDTGVHGIQFGDATASLVSPAVYSRFVRPAQERVLEALAGTGCDLWIHICGRTDHLLPLLRDLPFEGFEVDAKVELGTAREMLGSRIALKGNLDTTFLLQRSPQEVYEACRKILSGAEVATGVILSPGCGVPRFTPVENLRAMVRACADHRVPPGTGPAAN